MSTPTFMSRRESFFDQVTNKSIIAVAQKQMMPHRDSVCGLLVDNNLSKSSLLVQMALNVSEVEPPISKRGGAIL